MKPPWSESEPWFHMSSPMRKERLFTLPSDRTRLASLSLLTVVLCLFTWQPATAHISAGKIFKQQVTEKGSGCGYLY
jgi:hypothetical protein